MKERQWLRGASRALPVVMGYIPIGFAFGVLAQKAGLSVWHTLAMSVFVFAGSSQLIAVGLIAAGTAPISIIITTFIVNLRHMLMAASVSPHLKGWRKRELAGFACELTDETFAIHSVSFANGTPSKGEVFTTNIVSQLSWVVGSWLGVTMGQLISDVRPYGLDYALAAMFIALLVMQISNWVQAAVAVAAGVLSLGFMFLGWDQWHVILATVIGATVGVVVEECSKKR
ncbi:MAG: AzlC family ABC transporter permease [Anaerolineaceae bacterium]|nr:AzlC family ABC transporter permease [Anaerolineaceae bacterium]